MEFSQVLQLQRQKEDRELDIVPEMLFPEK